MSPPAGRSTAPPRRPGAATLSPGAYRMSGEEGGESRPRGDRRLERVLHGVAKAKAELDDIMEPAMSWQDDEGWTLPEDTVLGLATRLQAMRRLRAEHLPSELLAEPAWDILLALSASGCSGQDLSKSDVTGRTDLPRSTVGRWLATLEEVGLVERVLSNTADARHLFRLSAEGRRRMIALLTAMTGHLQQLR